MNEWTGTIANMFNVYHNYDALSSKQCIVEAAKDVPWLRSKEAFLELLQRVCEATDNWLIQAADCTNNMPSSSSETSSSTDSSCSSSGGNSSRPMTVVPLLSCFRNSSLPNLDKSGDADYTMQDLIHSYRENWVARWNGCLRHFSEWFPFPDATPSAEVVEASCSAVTSITAEVDATSALTKESIQITDETRTASSAEFLDNTNENKGKDTRNPEDAKTCAKRNAVDFECDT